MLALRRVDRACADAIIGLHLDCGAYDLSGTPSSRAATAETLVLVRDWIDTFRDWFTGGADEDERRSASMSPLYTDRAELAALPPTMLVAGALDPLVDDTVFLGGRLELAGVEVEVDVWPEGAHAFSNMGSPLQPLALERTVEWLERRLGP